MLMVYVLEVPFGAVTIIDTTVVVPGPSSLSVACPSFGRSPDITACGSDLVAETVTSATAVATFTV